MKTKMWLIVIAVIVLTAGASAWVTQRICQQGMDAAIEAYMESYRISQGYQRAVSAWANTLANEEADAAFLGDSLISVGEWDMYYPEQKIKNLGVSGDTIADVHSRLALLEELQPRKCFVLIGINDLWLETWQEETPQKMVAAYQKLLTDLLKTRQSSDQQLFVLSLLPVREQEINAPLLKNVHIRSVNEQIKALTETLDVPFIDIHSLLADEEGQLKKEYSADGLHLTPLGYEVWSQALRPCVEQ